MNEGNNTQEKTYFAPGTAFDGTLTAQGDVEIAGEISGEIISEGKVSLRRVGNVSISSRDLELLDAEFIGDVTVQGDVIVDGGSSLKGNVRAARVLCRGAIHGNLNAAESVTLDERAVVTGDIKTPVMDVAQGARISGQVQMTE